MGKLEREDTRIMKMELVLLWPVNVQDLHITALHTVREKGREGGGEGEGEREKERGRRREDRRRERRVGERAGEKEGEVREGGEREEYERGWEKRRGK